MIGEVWCLNGHLCAGDGRSVGEADVTAMVRCCQHVELSLRGAGAKCCSRPIIEFLFVLLMDWKSLFALCCHSRCSRCVFGVRMGVSRVVGGFTLSWSKYPFFKRPLFFPSKIHYSSQLSHT